MPKESLQNSSKYIHHSIKFRLDKFHTLFERNQMSYFRIADL